MDLFPFQITAAEEIANKFADYSQNPLLIDATQQVPFYQNLNSVTGSGKTLVLCDTISQIRTYLPEEPIVLWLSKGKVVVWQTFINLTTGKYGHLIPNFYVKPLMDCTPKDINKDDKGLILVATVGKFNQKDKEEGSRKIYQLALDNAGSTLWDQLKERKNKEGVRRPLIIVYDEGHNLSDQQTSLLVELKPTALISASATFRIPKELEKTINRLKDDRGWEDKSFTTTINSKEVVNAGLIKQQLLIGGYVTPMEDAIDDLLYQMSKTTKLASTLNLDFVPKAVYVSNTNIVGNSRQQDNTHVPFENRLSRPILIWRHLVQNHKINPSEIAVYCNLKFDKKFPPPATFNLFSGGDNDYDNFIAGNFKHIIFNQSLQEGWDDPTCYFAYIDKEMGSKDQITQVIGRVIRQPDAKHYSHPLLNSAQFFIRADEKKVFDEALQEVKEKLSVDAPDITITTFIGKKGSIKKIEQLPKGKYKLPETSIDSTNAIEPIKKIINGINDYRNDAVNTVGKGSRIVYLQKIGVKGKDTLEWKEVDHSNRVTARSIFIREVQRTYGRALNLCDIENPKFDAWIEYHSNAAHHIRAAASEVVKAYLENSVIIQNSTNPLIVPSIEIDPKNKINFKNAVHKEYSDLNSLEKEFAETLDKSSFIWFRNPPRGCFEIPLLAVGPSKNFNPDFIVWNKKDIVVIDTKGDHLILEASAKRLFTIDKFGKGGPDLKIKLVTAGEWNDQVEKEGNSGYTVWSLKNGRVQGQHADDISSTVSLCLH